VKNYILHIARELDVPVTVRRVTGGLIFWRSTDEDAQQTQEIARQRQGTTRTRSTPVQPPPRRRTTPRR